MCGLVGIINFKKKNYHLLKKKVSDALKIQSHRGPDDSGILLDESNDLCIGMNRLSIVDIKNGNQPYFSYDKKQCIIFNGEIINSGDLKKKYFNNSNNFHFKSKNSDTELLLNLLILKGEDCLNELNGMFTFCFIDFNKYQVLIARDRFGIKPLYYSNNDNSFCFASEIQTLLKLQDTNFNINIQSLYDYLSLMYVPAPNTIYEGINKLSPGEKIIIDLKKKIIDKKKWHTHKFKPNLNLNYSSIKEEFFDLTKKAILNWTQSDVPICNSLSGGLDSSVISSMLGYNKFNISNYSIGFLDIDDDEFDELSLAQKTSEIWSQKHYVKKINSKTIIDEIDHLMSSLHEPYGGGLPSWIVYKEISSKFKVALNGTGIDEFFGNYAKWSSFNTLFSKKINFKNFEKNFFNKRYYGSINEKKNIFNNDISKLEPTAEKFYNIYNSSDDDDIYNKSALLDIKTQLPDEFLSVCDAFSMRNSLEVRPPFLDNNLTDFLFSIPSNIRVGPKNNLKKLFKDTFKVFLNNEILNSKKRGFILPVERWLKKDMKFLLDKYLNKKKLDEHGLFNSNICTEIVDNFLKRGKISAKFDKFHRKQTFIWGILFFQLWFEKHINNKTIK